MTTIFIKNNPIALDNFHYHKLLVDVLSIYCKGIIVRKEELEDYRKLSRAMQGWQMKAHLMQSMLNALGVDVDDIMEADKDKAAQMLLNRHDYIKRANPLPYLKSSKGRPVRKA